MKHFEVCLRPHVAATIVVSVGAHTAHEAIEKAEEANQGYFAVSTKEDATHGE